MKLNELFNVLNGSALDLNRMVKVDSAEFNSANFVSRAEKNQGVVARVKIIPEVIPFESGLISVALGGSVLSTFVQQSRFYTGEHMRVLEPKREMSLFEKLYYCLCITKNRYRYSSHGRAADRTLHDLDLPDNVPEFVNEKTVENTTEAVVDEALGSLEEI